MAKHISKMFTSDVQVVTVGGPCAGRWVTLVNGALKIKLSSSSGIPYTKNAPVDDSPIPPMFVDQVWYTLRIIKPSGNHARFILVPDYMTIAEAFDEMLATYRDFKSGEIF